MPVLPNRAWSIQQALSATQLLPSLVKTKGKKASTIEEKDLRSLLEDCIDMVLDADNVPTDNVPTAMMAYVNKKPPPTKQQEWWEDRTATQET